MRTGIQAICHEVSDMKPVIRNIRLTDIPELKSFRCGNTSMEVFLFEEAYYYHILGEGVTKIVIDEETNEIIAYFTLKCDALKLMDGETNPEPRYFPCIEISRLAIAAEWQSGKKGISLGRELMCYLINFIKKVIAVNVGCHFITLQALAEKAEWYKKFGFIEATDEKALPKGQPVYMYLDIKDDAAVERYLAYRQKNAEGEPQEDMGL